MYCDFSAQQKFAHEHLHSFVVPWVTMPLHPLLFLGHDAKPPYKCHVQTYPWTSLCTISSLVIRCVVLLSSPMSVLMLCDHSLRIPFGSLCWLKFTMPLGRSILANTVLDTTRSDRNCSLSCRWKIANWVCTQCNKKQQINNVYLCKTVQTFVQVWGSCTA